MSQISLVRITGSIIPDYPGFLDRHCELVTIMRSQSFDAEHDSGYPQQSASAWRNYTRGESEFIRLFYLRCSYALCYKARYEDPSDPHHYAKTRTRQNLQHIILPPPAVLALIHHSRLVHTDWNGRTIRGQSTGLLNLKWVIRATHVCVREPRSGTMQASNTV